MAAKKWDMAEAVASHLVKVEPEKRRLADQPRIFCQARREHRESGINFAAGAIDTSQSAMIAFSLACYASVTGRMEEKVRLRHAIELDKDIRRLAIDDEDLRPLWDWIAGLE
jgi:hypothetical protein